MKDLGKYFKDIILSETLKNVGMSNPLMTQRFSADPYAISYNGRVYIYATGDVLEYNDKGELKNNGYGKIRTLNICSSADMVNWTDHGWIQVNGPFGITKWGGNSWAPAVTHKKIDGQDKFFLYFANNGNGIGVLVSDSPTGPFTDPLGKALINRETSNCANVTWLFDPAVFVDDDGSAYIYFGGGIPEERYTNPGTARMAKLGEDMISLACDPITFDVPYFYEDSGINKIDDTYYYSYCTNWNIDSEGKVQYKIDNAHIAYMKSKSPLGPFEFVGSIFENPGNYFGCYGNNHHCIFKHEEKWYIAYHTEVLLNRMKEINAKGYRCLHVDKVIIGNDGLIEPGKYTEQGIEAIQNLDPFKLTQAQTIGTMAGISVIYIGERSLYAEGKLVVSGINTGDWLMIYSADFKDGASKFTANVSGATASFGIIEIRAGGITGDPIGHLKIEVGAIDVFNEITINLDKKISGVCDLTFVFYGEGYNFDYWYFS